MEFPTEIVVQTKDGRFLKGIKTVANIESPNQKIPIYRVESGEPKTLVEMMKVYGGK